MTRDNSAESMIPENIETFEEELKTLAGAVFNLMKNIPNCYSCISAHNSNGMALFINIHTEDGEKITDINKCLYDFSDGVWKDTYPPEMEG